MAVRVWAAIGGAAFAWGTTGVATRAALNAGVEPIAMAAIRSVLAAVLLYGILLARRMPIPRDKDRWRTGAVAAVLQLAAPFVLFTIAYQYAGAGFIGLIVALVPLVTAVIAHFVLPDEPLHKAKVASLSVAFAGVALLLLSGDSGLEEGGRPLLASILSILAVVAIAYSGVFIKSRAGRYDPIELTWMQFAMGGVLVVGIMFVFEGMPAGISTWGWVLIAYLTVVGSVAPFLLYFWVLRHVSSTRASLVGYVVPLISIVAGIVLLDEQLQLGIAAGGALIFTGIILTNRVEGRPVPRDPVIPVR